jgi:hypothetical protein
LDAISHLTAQVLAAEEAINLREERIGKLQQDLREKDETVAVLEAQVGMCNDHDNCSDTAARDTAVAGDGDGGGGVVIMVVMVVVATMTMTMWWWWW